MQYTVLRGDRRVIEMVKKIVQDTYENDSVYVYECPNCGSREGYAKTEDKDNCYKIEHRFVCSDCNSMIEFVYELASVKRIKLVNDESLIDDIVKTMGSTKLADSAKAQIILNYVQKAYEAKEQQ